MRKVFLLVAILLWSTSDAAQQASVSLEPDTDRPGMNYRNFDLEAPQPKLCRQSCEREEKCLAFTYVKPGIQGPKARCYLKSGIAPPRKGACCVSGVKAAGPAAGKPPTPTTMMPGRIPLSPKPRAGVPPRPPAAGHPATSRNKEIEAKIKMLSPSVRQPVKPLTRAELVNALLSNPEALPRLNQMASTLGMPAQQLATRSTSGKAVQDIPRTVPPTGATTNLNWEAGIRFTPRSHPGAWMIIEHANFIDIDADYGFSAMYQRDELCLTGGSGDALVSFGVYVPPGDYAITLELENNSLGADGKLPLECADCMKGMATLFPVIDKKFLSDKVIHNYIGQVDSHQGVLRFDIRIPSGTNWGYFVGIFRGITLTRL